MREPAKLLTVEFVVLNLVVALSFCNISVFYSFFHYLGTLDLPPAWRGFLVGLEPLTAFVLRLVAIPFIHGRNALALMAVSLVTLILVSWSYLGAVTIPALIALRVLHGATFVLLTSAAISLLVLFIPREKSGQGFGLVSVATMLPYAVMPPLMEALLPFVGDEARIYAGVSGFGLLALLLIAATGRRIAGSLKARQTAPLGRPPLAGIGENLRQRDVLWLLAVILLVCLAHASVFYFMKNLSLETRAGQVGQFFLIAMVAMIVVRAFGGLVIDRLDKFLLLTAALAVLLCCFLLFPRVGAPSLYYSLAGLYGVSMGVILPILNALLFAASSPAMRGVNTNFSLFMMDAGYFLTPYLGGMLVAGGAGFGSVFVGGAGFVLLALILVVVLAQRQGSGRQDR